MAAFDVSDGEIVEDLSEISSGEDDYFENLKKLTARKLELELQNTIAFGQFADYGKENQYSNHRKLDRKRPSTAKKRLKSGSRYEFSRQDAKRNHSYRASSVFSNYSIHKRKRNRRSHRHIKRPRQEDESRSVIMLSPNSEDESSDEELLQLRLTALKSKLKSQEGKEHLSVENESEPAVANQPNEEENLRILALKSAVLKKKEFFKERKQKRKMESERPYSPSDDLTPLIIDDDAMVLSPLGSPFNEIKDDEQEIDMDISNSPMNEEKGTSDMDTSPSPGNVNNEPTEADDHDEETALRSLLLTSIYKKKDVDKTRSPTPEIVTDSGTESASIAQNLKMAVQRLKEKKKVKAPVAKSGTKTIAMILEENKHKKKIKLEQELLIKTEPVEHGEPAAPELAETLINPHAEHSSPLNGITEVSESVETVEKDGPSLEEPPASVNTKPLTENFLFRTITNDLVKVNTATPETKTSQRTSPLIEPDSSFSTITDTKNIPLLSASNKAKRSRLITPLEFVTSPVPRLVIEVRVDSDTDDETNRNRKIPIKKTARKIIRAPEAKPKPKTPTAQPEFEKNLESFLKNIRMQQEKAGSEKTSNIKTPSKAIQPLKTPLVPTTTTLTKPLSSVKHLPLSSQVEYEQLLQKMKVLEEAKLKRLKARQLKRTKSNSGSTEPADKGPTAPVPATKTPAPKKPVELKPDAIKKKSTDKIKESLSQISQLDEAAQQRLIEKTEINFKKHSTNLIDSTRQSIKLLEDNEVDLKRQEKLGEQIAEIEQMLKKYKANLNVVNQRVKVNVHKIVQSQREMIKLRIHQVNFGKICQQVGSMVLGEEYSLPDNQSAEAEENFIKIVSKTEEIMKKSTEQNVKSNMKLIADRVKSFVNVKEPGGKSGSNEAVTNELLCAKAGEPDLSAVNPNNLTTIPTEEESEVTRMIKDNNEHPIKEESFEEMKFPEVQKQTIGVLEVGGSGAKRFQESPSKDQSVVKKLKYESPLDFLRLPKNKTPSVNKIVCPYQLEGTCHDDKCQMMHI